MSAAALGSSAVVSASLNSRMPNFAPSADAAVNDTRSDEDTRAWLGALADQQDPSGVFRVGQVVRAAR